VRDRFAMTALMIAGALATGGCMAPAGGREWFANAQSKSLDRAPTGRVTQADVVALNEAVEGLAHTENPGRFAEASARLASLLPRFEAAGEQSLAAETLLWLAYCYEKNNNKSDAAVFYDQVIKKYPQTAAAERAKARRAALEFRRPPE
jgi:hypothetical protein